MTYTMVATVELTADSPQEAQAYLRHALEHARKTEIVLVDAEIHEAREDEDAPARRGR